MDNEAKLFLLDLLNTPSPSGQEWMLQRKWIDYVKPFAHEIRTDLAGNAIGIVNPNAPFKVLLAGHCDEIGLIVSRIDEKGFVYVEALGGISPKLAVGMKVNILGYRGTLTGVIGANAQHHGGLKENFEFSDICIDCGAGSKEEIAGIVQVGDLAVYKREPELLLNDRISGRGLDNRTGAFIVAETLRRVAKRGATVGVYAASTVNEETNMGGAYFAASGLSPNAALAMDVTFATDYPGASTKNEVIRLDGGPVLAKGAPINRKINLLLEQAAERKSIPLQYELTPRHTGTDADKIRYTGAGVPISLVSLPLRYMHAPVETVSLRDIEQEIELLVDMLVHLTGSENLNPIDDEL
jgi:putative aminopeptidase FrvX